MTETTEKPKDHQHPARWQTVVLWLACLHSGVWSLFIMALPELSAKVYGLSETPHELHLWQGTGLFIGLLAFGYGLAAVNPSQHWGLVLVGLLAKIFGAIGMTVAVFRGQVPADVLWLLPLNDMIWYWPFWRVVRDNRPASSVSHRLR